jgi:AraC-like DNA-binding protein
MGRSPALPPKVEGGIARVAAERCRLAGVAVAPLLRRAGLTERDMVDLRSRIPASKQVAFLNLAADALGDALLGFHIAQDVDLRRAGLIYYVLASSATFGEAVKRACRYSSIVNEGLRLTRLEGDETGIRYECVGMARHKDRHQIEFWVTYMIRLARQFTGTRAAPLRATLVHPRCEASDQIEAFIACAIAFGSPYDEVSFKPGFAEHHLVGADPFLNEMLVGYCEEALEQRSRPDEALRTRIENAVTPMLPHGRALAADVARRLGMSLRTMTRQLAAEDLSFSLILDELRADLALRYLREPSLTISQIAWLLGFQDVSAFTHAFRRWTGMSPTRVRATEQWRKRPAPASAETQM